MTTLLALYTVAGLLMAGFSVPLISNKIPPNGFYGFRVRATLDDPQLWYKVNAYSGRRLLVLGLGTALASIILYYTSGNNLEQYALSCLAVFLALFLWAIITSFLYMRSFQ